MVDNRWASCSSDSKPVQRTRSNRSHRNRGHGGSCSSGSPGWLQTRCRRRRKISSRSCSTYPTLWTSGDSWPWHSFLPGLPWTFGSDAKMTSLPICHTGSPCRASWGCSSRSVTGSCRVGNARPGWTSGLECTTSSSPRGRGG